MTDLDELRSVWEAHGRKLDQSIRLNREVLGSQRLMRLQAPLRKLSAGLWLELGAALVAVLVVGSFLGDHVAEARFVWPAALLCAWLTFCLASCVRQLVALSGLAWDGPVLAMQQQLTQLRLLRLRTVRVALLTGQLVWGLPFLVVALKMGLGIDAFRFLDPSFVAVTLTAGVAVIPLAIWLTVRFGERLAEATFFRRLADEIAGKSLREASRQLALLSDYQD